ncbi:MAG: hypothetical protein ACR2OI_09010 [Acidimicrobiia bacterium]
MVQPTRPGRSLRIGIFCLIIAALVLDAHPAAADEGLSLRSETTYLLSPEDGVVSVEAEYTLENTTPNQVSGNRITQFFYESIQIPLPETAEAVIAESDGRELEVGIGEFEGFPVADIKLRKKLWYRQTQTVTVHYDIPSEPPRSEALVRVNTAYAAFPAFGFGDVGEVTVRVVLPRDFEIEVWGSNLARTRGEDDMAVYVAADIANPDEWFAFITARRDTGLASTRAVVDDYAAVIRFWPDDQRWASFVETQFVDRVPLMADLIGLEWPLTGDLEVIETISPNLYGYAGWFILDENLIEIDESLDAHVILHEFAHAWFHRDNYRHRWLSEGLAEEVASRSIEEVGGALKRPEEVDRSSSAAIPLNRWDLYERARQRNDEREQYGYDASWHVLREITEEIGMDGLRDVLAAIELGHSAYLGEDPPQGSEREIVDWRRFLDLVEERGNTETVDDVFLEFVVADVDRSLVAGRDDARRDYQDLQDQGQSWAAPDGVRELMEAWDFDAAQEAIGVAATVLDRRDQLATRAASLNVAPPPALERMYEEAVDLKAPSDEVDRQLASIEALSQASIALAADRDLWTKIGLLGTDLEVDYRAIEASFEAGRSDSSIEQSAALIETLHDASNLGRERSIKSALGLISGILVIVLLVRWVVRARRKKLRVSLD